MYLPYVNSRYVYAIDDTRARDKLTSLARSSVLDAGRGWIRSTGPARHGSGRSSQPLRSYRVRPSIAHRTCAALSRTSTTFGGGVHSPPGAFVVVESFIACRDSLVARAARGCRAHARRPLAAHAPRARASASPGTADGRSWERSNAAVSPPAIVAGGQTEATSGGSSDRTDNYMSRTTRTHTTWDGTTLRSNVLAVRCVHSWSIYIKRRTDGLCAAAGFVRS